MPTERFQFTGVGGHQLAAALDMPEREPLAYALFAHCFTCGKDVLAAKRIAVALAAEGIAVLRFDFTGLGSSEGDFANSTFSSNVADLVRAADHLRETRQSPAILIGHSLGGAAVLAAAGQIPEAKAVVTIAAPICSWAAPLTTGNRWSCTCFARCPTHRATRPATRRRCSRRSPNTSSAAAGGACPRQ